MTVYDDDAYLRASQRGLREAIAEAEALDCYESLVSRHQLNEALALLRRVEAAKQEVKDRLPHMCFKSADDYDALTERLAALDAASQELVRLFEGRIRSMTPREEASYGTHE